MYIFLFIIKNKWIDNKQDHLKLSHLNVKISKKHN